jgi:hypothetical protein
MPLGPPVAVRPQFSDETQYDFSEQLAHLKVLQRKPP